VRAAAQKLVVELDLYNQHPRQTGAEVLRGPPADPTR